MQACDSWSARTTRARRWTLPSASCARAGTRSRFSIADQWPDVAQQVARSVAAGEADQGVLFCWTGTGTSIAANKVPGVRAALAWDPWIAEGARRWNDANVLVMSLKRTTPEAAREIVDAWLSVEAPDEDERENIAKLETP